MPGDLSTLTRFNVIQENQQGWPLVRQVADLNSAQERESD